MHHISVTGHRPDKLGGYAPCAKHRAIRRHMRDTLLDLKAKHGELTIYSGGALGIDQFWMQVGHYLELPVVAILPFPSFDRIWPQESKDELKELLDKCVEVRYSSQDHEAKTKAEITVALYKRNQDLVAACDTLVAYWNGTTGGTAHAVRSAKAAFKPTLIFNPDELT